MGNVVETQAGEIQWAHLELLKLDKYNLILHDENNENSITIKGTLQFPYLPIISFEEECHHQICHFSSHFLRKEPDHPFQE